VGASDPAASRLAKVAGAGVVLLALGGVLVWLLTPLAWALVLIGAAFLLVGPVIVAGKASGALHAQDHKVEGRTFVIDLWRSVKQPELESHDDRGRDSSGRPP
jgi:hypothetical protein